MPRLHRRSWFNNTVMAQMSTDQPASARTARQSRQTSKAARADLRRAKQARPTCQQAPHPPPCSLLPEGDPKHQHQGDEKQGSTYPRRRAQPIGQGHKGQESNPYHQQADALHKLFANDRGQSKGHSLALAFPRQVGANQRPQLCRKHPVHQLGDGQNLEETRSGRWRMGREEALPPSCDGPEGKELNRDGGHEGHQAHIAKNGCNRIPLHAPKDKHETAQADEQAQQDAQRAVHPLAGLLHTELPLRTLFTDRPCSDMPSSSYM